MKTENKKTGVAQTNLSLTDIGNLNIIIPDVKRQKEFNIELDRSSQKINAYLNGQSQLTDKQFTAEKQNNDQLLKKISNEEKFQASQEKALSKQNRQLEQQNVKTVEIGKNIVSNITKTEATTKKLNQNFSLSQQKAENIKKEIQYTTNEIEIYSRAGVGLIRILAGKMCWSFVSGVTSVIIL